MTSMIAEYLSWIFLFAGSFFYFVGAVGIVRMPDVFSRMHAASVSDTLGAVLILIGLMLQAGLSLVLAKLAIILLIILYTGPVATHALARAARFAGVQPILAADGISKGEPAKKSTRNKKPAKRKSTKRAKA